MRPLRLEVLELRALPAANPLAGAIATDAPNTGTPQTDPSEAVAFEHCVGPAAAVAHGVGGTPPNSAAPSETIAPPSGPQAEWDDGWWMLDFSDTRSSASGPPPNDSLSQPPPSNRLDEWERTWFLDQPAHSPAAAVGQPDESNGQSPECLAYDEALAEIGEQSGNNTNGYFYSHAYTMHYSEPAATSDAGLADATSAPNTLAETDHSAGGPHGNQPTGQSAEVNMPDGGTVVLGGIKRAADTIEESGFRIQV